MITKMADGYVRVLIVSALLCYVRGFLTAATPCAPLAIQSDYIVCVCNSTYCDTVPSAEKLPAGQFVVFTSAQNGQRFDKQVSPVSNVSKTDSIYLVNLTETRQTIIGFGGAFTDAAGINIAKLPQAAQDLLINSYYSKDGLEYNIGRVPMASTDFSTHVYSYDDVPGDLNLTKFALAPEDFQFKIPYIQKALKVSPNPVRLFASPWSAPGWMKDTGKMNGGSLLGEPGGPYYKTWANYFVRFLEEYANNNITFWGLTVQNEPLDGFDANFSFQAMAFKPSQQRDFVKLDLGPALHSSGHGDIKLMMLDDQRLLLVAWSQIVLSDPEANKYISGIAVHWYGDIFSPLSDLDDAHNAFPDKFLFGSEACEGSDPWEVQVDLGAWDRASSYAHDIIEDLNHWVTGWTDWNLALDLQGGPNWVSNFVDSPIIVDAAKQQFYKEPMYYAMGHFSKYIVPGSVWLGTRAQKDNPLIELAAFHRPDNSIAVVIHNLGQDSVDLALDDGVTGYIQVTSPGNSIQTVVWWLD
jgi:glucosylceramidase